MSFIAAHLGALVAIHGGCLAAVFLGYSTLNSFSLTAAHGILLVAGYDVGLVAAHRGLLVCLDVGNLSVEVFCFCSLHIDCPVFRYRNRLVSSYRMGFIAANSGGQVFVNGVGHIFVSPVHQVLSRIGNHSFFSGILDIRSSLLGVGLVFSVTSVGIESVIAQVGGGVVRSIGCDTLDALAFYSQTTLVPLTICIGSFGPSGSAFFIVVDGAFFFAAIFRADGILVGGDFTGCHFRAAALYVVVTYNTNLGHVDFIHIQLAGNGQGTANGSVASGGNGFSAQVLHTGKVAILHGCRAIGDALTLDSAVCVNVTDKGSTGPRNGAVCVNVTDKGSTGPRNGAVCVNITQCRDVARRSYGAAGYRSVAHGSTLTVGYCFAGDGCLGSDISVFIYGEGPVGPFDLAVSLESRHCRISCIATGIETVFIHDSTIQAHFDALIAEGNLVFAIFVQHQFIHRRGWGAVVSGDFGNHAAVAHFEIILDLLIQLTQGFCIGAYLLGYRYKCINMVFIGFDLRIQGG